MPKSKTTKKGRNQRRNNDPLVQRPGALTDATAREKKEREIQFKEDVQHQQMVDGASTTKIMRMAREEQNELFGKQKKGELDLTNDDEFPSLGGGGGADFDDEEELEEQYEDFDGNDGQFNN